MLNSIQFPKWNKQACVQEATIWARRAKAGASPDRLQLRTCAGSRISVVYSLGQYRECIKYIQRAKESERERARKDERTETHSHTHTKMTHYYKKAKRYLRETKKNNEDVYQ